MKNIIIILIMTIIIITPITSLAEENYYINKNNVYISLEDYNLLLADYNEEQIDNFTQNEINILLTNDWERVGEQIKYYETTNFMDINGNVVISTTNEISEFIYNNVDPSIIGNNYDMNASCGTNCVSHETTYKKVSLFVDYGVSVSSTKIEVRNEWKIIPSVKRFDIIGFKIVSSQNDYISFMTTLYQAKQIWDGNTINYSYDTSSTGNTVVQNGVGVGQVMNIVNDTSNSLINTMTLYLIGSPVGLVINASYQHATSNSITKNDAKNVSFNGPASGYTILGGTFRYNNTIANYYDGMQGVSVSFYDYLS